MKKQPIPAPVPARAAMPRRLVFVLLPQEERVTVRARSEQLMEAGRDWVWRNELCYTASGMRVLAEAYRNAGDVEAAAICIGQAAKLDADDGAAGVFVPVLPPAVARADTPDTFAQLEKRGLA